MALRDAAILGFHCCCKEMSDVTRVDGVMSDDADVDLAADALTPRMHFANNSPFNSSPWWLLTSPFFRCRVCALVHIQLFAAGQLWQGRGCAEVTPGARFGTFLVTCAGVAASPALQDSLPCA